LKPEPPKTLLFQISLAIRNSFYSVLSNIKDFKMLSFLRFLSLAMFLAFTTTTPVFANEDSASCGPETASEEQILKLQLDNETLSLKIKQLELDRYIPSERLRQKKIQRLKEIAADVKIQRQTTHDFEGFAKWMSANLAGYNRYIQAGSYAAVAARMLPIPYAGQASIFTKFVAQFTVALNASSVSVNNYLNSSQKFVALVDTLDLSKPVDDKVLAEAARFADRQLIKDMQDAQTKLATVSDLSSGALSFLESINHFVCGTDEYWNKAKGIFKKNVDPTEKSFISENIGTLKSQADRFNGKLKMFSELSQKETASIKALAVYDELMHDSQISLLK